MSFDISESLSKDVRKQTNVFLTGVTGFLGAYLLHDLLQETQANVYCLVRASSYKEGLHRIKEALVSYMLWNTDFSSRIVPVTGDLSQPLLGLKVEQFRELASRLDNIYHNGAVVNFLYSYSQLRAVNVLGTQEILRLACQHNVKPLHYVSTIGVFHGAGSFSEGDKPESPAGHSGYSQSKWVAEKLVMTAKERGLPVTIYRPGRITGDSKTGVANLDDFSCRYIKAGIQLGSFPEEDKKFWVVPVDFVSRAIVYLSRQKKTRGRIFHLINPRPLTWQEIVDWLRSVGYQFETMPYAKWRAALEKQPANPLYVMLPILPKSRNSKANDQKERISQNQSVYFDCRNTLEGLSGSSIFCPPFTSELLHTYWRYMVESGFLVGA
jgi:thioester reductase-like protein